MVIAPGDPFKARPTLALKVQTSGEECLLGTRCAGLYVHSKLSSRIALSRVSAGRTGFRVLLNNQTLIAAKLVCYAHGPRHDRGSEKRGCSG